MKISCGIAPGEESVELAKLAEELGYERVWLYDSASLYEDIWVHLGLIAKETKKIGLGTAVLVPNLRHVMATASAIAAIHRISGGRLACAFGTGYTARLTLNKTALTWKYTEEYLRQLKGLLAGEVVVIEGENCQMIHEKRFGPARPIEVPILLSAFGEKGKAVARELADGIMGVGPAQDMGQTAAGEGDAGEKGKKWDWEVLMLNGTVLDEGEEPDSKRVIEAAGPWFTVGYHAMWSMDPEIVKTMPAGQEWLAGIEAERPEGERHLAVHGGHVTDITERDRIIFDATSSSDSSPDWGGWVGTKKEIQEKAKEAEAGGATELLYTPAGPDMKREIQAFADALI